MHRKCRAFRRMEDGNRATSCSFLERFSHSDGIAIPSDWENRSRKEQLDNWYSAAPGRRIWQINQSLHYLSDCVNKKSNIILRCARQDAMAQAADPTRPFLIRNRCKVSIQMLL